MIANIAFANYPFLPCKFNWLNANEVFSMDKFESLRPRHFS